MADNLTTVYTFAMKKLAGYSLHLLKEEKLEGKEIQFKQELYLLKNKNLLIIKC